MATNLKATVSWLEDGVSNTAAVSFGDNVEPHEVVDGLLELSGSLGKPRIDKIK